MELHVSFVQENVTDKELVGQHSRSRPVVDLLTKPLPTTRFFLGTNMM